MMKRIFQFSLVLMCLWVSVCFAGPADIIVLAVAPNVELREVDEPFASMPYYLSMTTWTVDVYNYWAKKYPFDPSGFDPGAGYKKGMNFTAIAPDPDTALAELLTGRKLKAGQEVTDPTLMEILKEKKGYEILVTASCAEALNAMLEFKQNENATGLFVMILYEEEDDESFRLGIQDIVDLVSSEKEHFSRMSWRNTLLVVTQGWLPGSNAPVPVFAQGEPAYRFSAFSGWYANAPYVIDNTQVYGIILNAAFVPARPKQWPLSTPQSSSGCCGTRSDGGLPVIWPFAPSVGLSSIW